MKPTVTTDPEGRGQMLLPVPGLVEEEISRIPHGNLLTVSELRLRLARRFDADLACPLMTRIFYNLVAGAAKEQLEEARTSLPPTGGSFEMMAR